ncbi:non-ribosomal peptide synthetase [Ruminiclostridium josui]|uniref:non-ribosomal peptide synthetase n=1 Tax=Ruminiclostridium josui TaxID=1499 RepID=UPI0006D1E5F6|nr:amino acid adenylation domain-containing protein [Ruminiclostridium josui]
MTDKQFLLRDNDHKRLLEWNKTFREYPLHKCLHEFIEEQVRKSPDNPAVRFDGEQLSYLEFNNRANRCARYLRSLGIGPDSIVGVIMERSLELPIALTAILKAGGAYLPLDPGYPEERIRFMLEDAGVSVILTQEKFGSIVGDFEGTKFYMDSQWKYISGEQGNDLDNLASSESLAYIIYTSGSTGKPKGCMLPHRAIVNRLLWMQEKYCLTESDRVLQKTPFTFDVSVWEFFWPLLSGACLVLAKPGGHKDSNYLVEAIRNEGITTCHFVPSMLRFFTGNPNVGKCNTLRQVFTSGEALTYDLMKEFKGNLGAELHNLYGPTEAAVDVTYWRCQEREDKKVPIGRPIFNIQTYILDDNLNQVSIGEEGELHIGGIGLAKGYLNRPDLTAEKFIDNPFSTEPGAKLYKTGDKCRFLPDGNIEFLGRMDFQVKLRGNRIELGEIEETLRAYDDIQEAVVLVKDQESLDPKLVAYIVKDGEFPTSKQLREFIKGRLPDYMVPNIFVPIASMPVTQHGKLDRKALPWPIKDTSTELQKTTGVKKELNINEDVSEFLLDFMVNALENREIKEDSDLFDFGATSLTMAQLVEKIQNQYGIQVPVDVFLDEPTIKAVSNYVTVKLRSKA